MTTTSPSRPTLDLREWDYVLISRARRAFCSDFRYLEQVLYAARTRLSPA